MKTDFPATFQMWNDILIMQSMLDACLTRQPDQEEMQAFKETYDKLVVQGVMEPTKDERVIVKRLQSLKEFLTA